MHVTGGIFHGVHSGVGGGGHHTSSGFGHQHHSPNSNHSDAFATVGLLVSPGPAAYRTSALVVPFKVPNNTILTLVSSNCQFPVQTYVPNPASRFCTLTELNEMINEANTVLKGAYPTQISLIVIILLSMAAGSMLYLTVFSHPDIAFVVILTFIGMAVGFVVSNIALKYYLQICERHLRQEMQKFIVRHNQREHSKMCHWEEFIPPAQGRDTFPVYLFLVSKEEAVVQQADSIAHTAAVQLTTAENEFEFIDRPSAPLLHAESV